MCIYSPMPHTLSYCAVIGKCAIIRSNTVNYFQNVMCPYTLIRVVSVFMLSIKVVEFMSKFRKFIWLHKYAG